MFHLIDKIVQADKATLEKMISEYEPVAKNSNNFQAQLNAELIIDACKRELASR